MDFEALSVFRLKTGPHGSPEHGLCAMEAVAWLEGLRHDDHPKCTCPVIAEFVRNINDSMPNDERQRLIAYLPRLVGTVSLEHENERGAYLAYEAAERFAGCGKDTRRAVKRALESDLDGFPEVAALDAAIAASQAYFEGMRNIWNHALEMLDGVLKIGPSGTFTTNIPERVNAYRREILKEAV